MPDDKMTKTNTLNIRCFCHLNIFIFVIVSYFVFRIFNQKTVFLVKHYSMFIYITFKIQAK